MSSLFVTFLKLDGEGLDGAGESFSASSACLVSNSPRVALANPLSTLLLIISGS
jgi:hypothetical protein